MKKPTKAVRLKRKAKVARASIATDVDGFMAALSHPLKAQIEAVRKTICAAAPGITEEIKWNSPGFRTIESFATVNLRSTERLQLIFHLGAKVRKPSPEMKISDPAGLMKWLGKDRALVTVDLPTQQDALAKLVRAWIAYL